jgi:hypothetical protein
MNAELVLSTTPSHREVLRRALPTFVASGEHTQASNTDPPVLVNKALAPWSGREVQDPTVARVGLAGWVKLLRLSWAGSQGLGLHGDQTSSPEDNPGWKSCAVVEMSFQSCQLQV